MKQEHIAHLLERYLDGETTNKEEQKLRRYFRETQIVPAEWRVYKALFAMTDAGFESHQDHRWRKLVAMAACVAALTVLIVMLWPRHDEPKAESSYAVIDGVVTTDQQLVADEAEQALTMVAVTEEELFGAFDTMNL